MAITPEQMRMWLNRPPEENTGLNLSEQEMDFIRNRITELAMLTPNLMQGNIGTTIGSIGTGTTGAVRDGVFNTFTLPPITMSSTGHIGAESFAPGTITWAQRDEQYQNMLRNRAAQWAEPRMTDLEMQMLRPEMLGTFTGTAEERTRARARFENQRIADERDIAFRRNDCLQNLVPQYVKVRKFSRRYQNEVILRPHDLNNTFRERLYNGSLAAFSFSRMDHMGEVVLFIKGAASLVFGINESMGEIHLVEILESPSREREKLKRLFLRHMGFNCVRDKENLKIEYSGGQVVNIPFGQGLSFRNEQGSRTIIGSRRR